VVNRLGGSKKALQTVPVFRGQVLASEVLIHRGADGPGQNAGRGIPDRGGDPRRERLVEKANLQGADLDRAIEGRRYFPVGHDPFPCVC